MNAPSRLPCLTLALRLNVRAGDITPHCPRVGLSFAMPVPSMLLDGGLHILPGESGFVHPSMTAGGGILKHGGSGSNGSWRESCAMTEGAATHL